MSYRASLFSPSLVSLLSRIGSAARSPFRLRVLGICARKLLGGSLRASDFHRILFVDTPCTTSWAVDCCRRLVSHPGLLQPVQSSQLIYIEPARYNSPVSPVWSRMEADARFRHRPRPRQRSRRRNCVSLLY